MILIACVDDNMGMLFNGRRQSQDSAIRARIKEITASHVLWMNSYSEKQFKVDDNTRIHVDNAFLEKASKGEFCFVENIDITPYIPKAEKIMLYKWNRHYPSDFSFCIPLVEQGWKMQSSYEFSGSSHEKITEEIYVL